ncbi:MAG: hypothetical protein P1V97_19015, partial [Planctomycetota bacterium]|nr:hypothetical protein [Planctomycetota bacterium]
DQQPEIDLCELLVQRGHLSSDQANFIQTHSAARSSEFIARVVTPPSMSSGSYADYDATDYRFQHPEYEVIGELGRGGISAAILVKDGRDVTIRRSSVRNYAGDGLFLEDNDPKDGVKLPCTNVKVLASEFSNSGRNGANIQKGKFFAEDCKFSGNKEWDCLASCLGILNVSEPRF